MSSTGQARWNRHNGHLLASTHGGDIKLWDCRKPSLPILYVSAHLARIFSLDWSRVQNDRLITSGQDCFVKFHDISPHGAKPDRSLKTAVAVWKARYTPFTYGLATVIVPQVHRNDHSLFVWNYNHLDFPVHSFVGHRDVILNFDWRRMPDNNKEMQLVTWSKDHTLRLWQVHPSIQNQCGKGETSADDTLICGSNDDNPSCNNEENDQNLPIEKPQDLRLPKEGENSKVSYFGERSVSDEPQSDRESTPSRTLTTNSLQQEFELLNLRLGSVKMEDVSSGKRTCKFTATVAANQALHRVSLIVNFPLDYPTNVPPHFTFGKGTTLDSNARSEILKTLNHTAKEKVRRNRTCLEPCLRQLETMLEQMPLVSDNGSDSPPYPLTVNSGKPSLGPVTSTDGLVATFDNANVPYPRSSGARFCQNGLYLVCFGRSAHQRTLQHNDVNKVIPTPRALSAYDARRQLLNQLETYHGSQQQVQRLLNSQSNPGFTIGLISAGNMNGSSVNLRSTNTEAQDMTRKGRFKVRKVKNSSDDLVKAVVFRDPKLKMTGASASPKLSYQPGTLGTGKITIFNISRLFPYSSELGGKYTLLDNPVDTCSTNFRVAALSGRHDLAKIWRICGQIAEAVQDDKSQSRQMNFIAWTHHPMGRPLLSSIIDHFVSIGDYQTAAMIACSFYHVKVRVAEEKSSPARIRPKQKKLVDSPSHLESNYQTIHIFEASTDKEISSKAASSSRTKQGQGSKKFWFMKPGAATAQLGDTGSPYHTVSATVATSSLVRRQSPSTSVRALPFNASETNLEALRTLQKSQRSNSWSDTFNDSSEDHSSICTQKVPHYFSPQKGPLGSRASESPHRRERLLCPKKEQFYESLKVFYANLLFSWRCFQNRCEVLNHSEVPADSAKHLQDVEITVRNVLNSDNLPVESGSLSRSTIRHSDMMCLLCNLPVRGLAAVCFACGHGGHLRHLQGWFQTRTTCISPGCSCPCLECMDPFKI